ncbi:MAG: hypothetical protein SOW59_00750 [Corynebacterium sp.]|nr:hypothetical protein [Corynebacterium sp.]
MLIDQLIETAATRTLNMDDFDATYANLQARHDHARAILGHVTTKIADRKDRLSQVRANQEYLDTQPVLDYTDDAWNLLVDQAIVDKDGIITIQFNDSTRADTSDSRHRIFH